MFIKGTNANLDYVWDWKAWLADGETIASHTLTADPGITIVSETEVDGVITVWLSGGAAGGAYDITCRVTTSLGRTDERTMHILVRER